LLMAVLALGWSYYTPLAAKGSEALMRWTAPLFCSASCRWSGGWL
jgi:hypothetical protein